MKTLTILLALGLAQAAHAATSPRCPGEEGYFFTNYKHRSNPTAGGFVSNTAFVNDQNDELFISPTAAVCGFASVEGRAGLRGNTIIRGNTQVRDSAVIQGNIIIEGDSVISGTTRIVGNGILKSVTIKDENRTLSEANPFEPQAAASPPAPSPYDLFTKLKDYISKKAGMLRKSEHDYLNYTEQEITFVGDPCVVILKKRFSFSASSASFSDEVRRESVIDVRKMALLDMVWVKQASAAT